MLSMPAASCKAAVLLRVPFSICLSSICCSCSCLSRRWRLCHSSITCMSGRWKGIELQVFCVNRIYLRSAVLPARPRTVLILNFDRSNQRYVVTLMFCFPFISWSWGAGPVLIRLIHSSDKKLIVFCTVPCKWYFLFNQPPGSRPVDMMMCNQPPGYM